MSMHPLTSLQYWRKILILVFSQYLAQTVQSSTLIGNSIHRNIFISKENFSITLQFTSTWRELRDDQISRLWRCQIWQHICKQWKEETQPYRAEKTEIKIPKLRSGLDNSGSHTHLQRPTTAACMVLNLPFIKMNHTRHTQHILADHRTEVTSKAYLERPKDFSCGKCKVLLAFQHLLQGNKNCCCLHCTINLRNVVPI